MSAVKKNNMFIHTIALIIGLNLNQYIDISFVNGGFEDFLIVFVITLSSYYVIAEVYDFVKGHKEKQKLKSK